MKYIDYEHTPEVLHILPPGSDGKEKHETSPARLVFIADDGTRTHVVPGTAEAEALFNEVRKNNPEPHKVEESVGPISEEAEPSKFKGKKPKVIEG